MMSSLCVHVCKEHAQMHACLEDGKVKFLDPGTHVAKTLSSIIWMTSVSQTITNTSFHSHWPGPPPPSCPLAAKQMVTY